MATTVFRSSNARFGAMALIVGFLALEAAIGGRALVTFVQQAVLAQSSMSQHSLIGN
jgi:hypothetical protein